MHTNNGITTIQPFGKFMDDFFNRSISDLVGTDFTYDSPSVNVIEIEDSFELEVAAPGLDKNDFKVTVEKDHLTISAEKEMEENEEYEGQTYKRREYNYQKFTRRFRLPKSVDKDSPKATYLDGILRITLDKTPEAKNNGPKTIEIS
ncbi:MAG: Hsp20/alpha crystallin family protein [Bacteroidota bacterium]